MGFQAQEEGLHQDFLAVEESLRIAVTVGDPAGVGPEVVRAALASPHLDKTYRFEVLGEGLGSGFEPGYPSVEGARMALDSLEKAASGCLEGRFAAVVTGPIHKSRMRSVGFDYPGQTEFFAERFAVSDYTMCLTGAALTVALVTAHVPLREVPLLLTSEAILRTGLQLAAFLSIRLGTFQGGRRPRIAVAGLNPHAGESGLLGKEDAEIVEPGVNLLNGQDVAEFSGPWSPDTVFHRAAAGEFDGVVCMYHDQGLIPLKLLAFYEGVNVTLGLPFPRTSPDHGTAFELAGRGGADPRSMVAAMNLASELVRKRHRPRP